MSSPVSTIHGYAALEKNGEIVAWSYEPRPLGPTDVEISITHCGVCASDAHAISGGWDKLGMPINSFPLIAGHEIVGVVSKAGSEVSKVSIGQRVGLGCISRTCLRCDLCAADKEFACPERVFTSNGVYEDGRFAQGGFAEAIRAGEDFVYVIPEALSSEHAAPMLCGGITVYAPLVNHGVGPGKTVGVVGIGGLGHLALQFANKLGAGVVAFSTSETKREEAIRLGAHKFVNTSDSAQLQAAKDTIDLLLVTANASNMPWDGYLWSVKRGGKVVIVGLPEEHIPVNVIPVLLNDISIMGSVIGGRQQHHDMLEFAAKHGVQSVVEMLPMNQVNDAIERVRRNDVRYRFVLHN
ncbi:putative mannitol dehydrogenase [Ramicandelaber brevisporus]|nr:putative mannitol dehydrogenase [Ramicandelaber brevisporus]